MEIQKLYEKDISRRINPAVVVSEMEEYFINQEIEEYVFTPTITQNIYSFLNAIANKQEGKTGVWISGYYGSGKSHFIKYLFYCLNKKYNEKALTYFTESVKEIDSLEEPNIGLVNNLKKKLDKLTVDQIIFNIDAVTKDDEYKNRLTRVLLNQLNAFRSYNVSNIALALYLEKVLDRAGKFDDFKKEIERVGKAAWNKKSIPRYLNSYLDTVIETAKKFDSDIDKESLKASILDRNQDYTIDFLVDELKDYLSEQSDNYRLIFLIDEVSQYIGSNTSLLLNLQTIVEEIGSQIGQKVWVVCTAQQDLSNLINNTDNKTEDFGKILGRFETMISLESQDAAFITKKRVLDKNSDGIGELNKYFKENKGAIENQFVFDHDLYKNYLQREDFTLTYPFIPYQFRLISDVFESFSNVGYVGEGVKNTERAILGITHETAKLCKDNEIGYFVPFDLFFNRMLSQHLSHHARSILDRAYGINEIKKGEFSERLVNTLFMISNLGEIQTVNFPATVENLSLLLMDSVDTAKLEMQNKVTSVLDILVTKNIIQVSEGKYRFLKEDEIDVAHLIKSTTVTTDDRLTYIYDDIIRKVINPNPNITFGNRNFRIALKIDDKEIGAKGDFNLKFSIYDNTELDNLAHSTASLDIVIGICEWFKNDDDLKTQVLDYVRTQKYIRLNYSSATGPRKETLNNFREANKILLGEINLRFEKKFLHTAMISNNQVIHAEELNGSSPSSRFDEMVKRHMEEVYRKHKLSNGYASSNADLINNAKSTQKQINADLTPAEEELNTKITLMGEAPVVGDIVKAFEKPPYGWKDINTMDVLLKIAKKGSRRFEWRNEEIDFITFAEKALNARERDAITVHKEKVHSQEEINSFIHAVNNEIFAETLIPSNTADFKEAVESFKKKLEPKLTKLDQLKDEFEAYPFASHLKSFHKTLGEIYNTRNPEQAVDLVMAQKDHLKLARDTYMYVEEFIQHHFKAYEQIAVFADANKNNFSSLDETLIVRSEELIQYLKIDHEPWDKFPQMKKSFKELNDAIKKRLTDLKSDVVQLYENIFEEIEARKIELNIDTANLTPSAEHYLQKIKKEDQITQLEIYELKANDFRAENFKKLEDYKAQEKAKDSGKTYVTSIDVSIAAEMQPTTIENEEQLNEYLKKLKAKLMVKLAKNQKIWLS